MVNVCHQIGDNSVTIFFKKIRRACYTCVMDGGPPMRVRRTTRGLLHAHVACRGRAVGSHDGCVGGATAEACGGGGAASTTSLRHWHSEGRGSGGIGGAGWAVLADGVALVERGRPSWWVVWQWKGAMTGGEGEPVGGEGVGRG